MAEVSNHRDRRVPRDVRTITLFLASPSDVAAERDSVRRTVDEWNQTRGRDRSTFFYLLSWETTVAAGFGLDGQDVVNTQIGNDYDALIALFWTRVGTATPRAASGSIEEYERALQRYRNNEDIEIAFLFKDAPVPISEIDVKQIGDLNALRSRIESEGALYKTFTHSDELKFEIGLLLDRLARKFDRTSSSDEPTPNLIPKPNRPDAQSSETGDGPDSSDDEDPGLLDVLERIEEKSQELVTFLSGMTERMNSMTSETKDVSQKMEELGKLGANHPSVIRPLVNRVSERMESLNDYLEENGSSYADTLIEIAEDIRNLIDISQDFRDDTTEAEDMERSLSQLLQAMIVSRSQVASLAESTASLHRMTTTFNKAKKRLSSNLNSHADDMGLALGVLESALEELRRMLP